MAMTTSMLEGAESFFKGARHLLGGKHLKYTLMGAAALGIATEHPFHGAYEGIVNEGIIGYPHATRAIANARLSSTLQGVIGGPLGASLGQTMQYYDERDKPLPRSVLDPNTTGPSLQGPSGDIVFGLHHLRA